jgi:amino acid adenylation domain-containing protein
VDRSATALDRARRLAGGDRARLLEALRERAVRRDDAGRIPRREPGSEAPLSYEQRRFWIVDRLDPGSPAYNVAASLPLRAHVEPAVLQRSLDAVVRRHEVLRTTFRDGEDEPVQVIHPPAPAALRVLDLSHLPPADRSAQAAAVAAEEAAHRFDLSAGPLLRVTLLRLGAAEAEIVLVAHHILADAVSMERLGGELRAHYAAFARGGEPSLPELPVQYADYAVWQRGWVGDPASAPHLEHWTRHLAGAPAVLELPTDRPRPPRPGTRGGAVEFDLSPDLASACRALARAEGATLFAVLLSAFAALVGRYAGQEDVVVGTTVANRARAELEELVGVFANVLPLRADLSGRPGFRTLVRRTHEVVAASHEHQSVPFELLVERLAPRRDLSRNPIFQVMCLLLSDTSSGAGVVADRDAPPRKPNAWATQFDLTLALSERGPRVSGALEHGADLFDAPTVERMARQYVALLAAAAAHPDVPLADLPLAGGDELVHQRAWGTAEPTEIPARGVHHMVRVSAERTPEKAAVTCGCAAITYAELEARSNRLARHLAARGARRGTRVGVCVERSVEMVVALLAVMKTGAAYVPLDPAYPAERVAMVLQDAGIALLISESTVHARLADPPASVLLDRDADVISVESEEPVDGGAGPEDTAYVIYTSGSTGRPKGVMVPHRALSNFVASIQETPGISPDDVLAAVTTLSFDIAALELFVPLAAGARVALMPRETVADGQLLAAALAEEGATVMQATPAGWRSLLEAGWRCAPGLRMLCGGEALPWDLARALLEGGGELWNLYGPTETTIWSAARRVDAEDGAALVGGPVANTRLHVLDDGFRPLPTGVPGELFIGGDGVAAGYLDRPATTAERFVPDPFSPGPGARMYRTGDRVRWSGGGALRFLGRTDHQVKVRGHRIEPGEIEAALADHAAVAQALVVAAPDASGEKRLVAYVAGPHGAHVPAAELRAHLRGRLPAYMVPSVVVGLSAMPLTPNGKVDRAQLPEPSQSRDGAEGYEAPATDAERDLVEVWESLLGVRPVGVGDDFFALGGHSMLAVRMMARLRARFGVDLPLAALFERPTVRDLAALLADGGRQARAAEETRSPVVAIQPAGHRVPLWFVHPIGGEVLCYADLARELGADQPFLAFRARDLSTAAGAAESIPEMAATYVRALREARPDGPYLLGGWSFGGAVAFEMAARLSADGADVPLLALVDPESPAAARASAARDEAQVMVEMAHEHAMQHGVDLDLSPAELAGLATPERVRHVLGRLRERGLVAPEIDAAWLERFLAGYQARKRAAAEHRPGTYGGRVVLFQPSEPERTGDPLPFGPDAPSGAWRAHCSAPVAMHVLPGRHGGLARGASGAALARRLREAIDHVLRS